MAKRRVNTRQIMLHGNTYTVRESDLDDVVLLESKKGGCAVGVSTAHFVIAFYTPGEK